MNLILIRLGDNYQQQLTVRCLLNIYYEQFGNRNYAFSVEFLIDIDDFKRLISRNLDMNSPVAEALVSKGFIYVDTDLSFSESVKWALLNTKSHVATATSLHIIVVTTACNMNCIYCQANNGLNYPNCFMDIETAERAVDIELQSPERS